MALPIGKLAILVGAGIVGSVLAKEGRLSNVSDFFSGALKIVLKQAREDNTTASSGKPRNDSLLQQVNSLRQELQYLASNKPVTIVTSSGSGSSKYGVIIVVVVVGYGYVWWKGWKLPDMMFATKRSLNDACGAIARQLEDVYSSISATKRHLSAKIDHVDCSLDESAELTASTKEEVSELRGEMKEISVDVQSVHHMVQTLETKIHRIEGKQESTNEGVNRLLNIAWTIGNDPGTERLQVASSSSSQSVLELPQLTTSSRSASLPPSSLLELPSPSSSNGSHKFQVKPPLQSTVTASGLKEIYGVSDVAEAFGSPRVPNGVAVPEDEVNGNSGSSLFGLYQKIPGFITRSRSAIQSFK